jgi:hypothetical protein
MPDWDFGCKMIVEKGTYSPFLRDLFRKVRLSQNCQSVINWLVAYSNKLGQTKVLNETIALDAQISIKTVQRTLKELKELGLVSTKINRGASIYQLHIGMYIDAPKLGKKVIHKDGQIDLPKVIHRRQIDLPDRSICPPLISVDNFLEDIKNQLVKGKKT